MTNYQSNLHFSSGFPDQPQQPQLPASQNIFVNVSLDLEQRVDEAIPHNEKIGKFRFGRFVVNNRRGLVKLIVAFIALAMLTMFFFFVRTAYNLGTLAANGLTTHIPFTAPWTSEEAIHEALMRRISQSVVVSGATVTNVVEPLEKVANIEHISLLIHGVDKNNTLGKINEADLLRGYLSWKAFWSTLSANFTLQHVNRLMRMHAANDKENHTCVCFVEYGLPYNAVYIPASDSTLYGPQIEARSPETARIRTSCRFKTLVEKFFYVNEKKLSISDFVKYDTEQKPVPNRNDSQEWDEVSKTGAVSYIDKDFAKKQQVFGTPEFPCIEHCVSQYKSLLRPLKEEIKF